MNTVTRTSRRILLSGTVIGVASTALYLSWPIPLINIGINATCAILTPLVITAFPDAIKTVRTPILHLLRLRYNGLRPRIQQNNGFDDDQMALYSHLVSHVTIGKSTEWSVVICAVVLFLIMRWILLYIVERTTTTTANHIQSENSNE
jgi:hypothetical protein